MKMDKLDRIKEDVLKSGIPLEIEISSVLRKNGWFVINQSPYMDKDEDKVRTIDILASLRQKPFQIEGKSINLVIECKKSEEENWVFYTQPKSSDSYVLAVSVIESLKKLIHTKQKEELAKRLHFANKDVRVGIVNYVPFRQRDSFFEAHQQVTKALQYFSEKWGKGSLNYPVIVFDGEMYDFDIHEEARVKPIEYLQYVGIKREERLIPCMIDVVKRSYFPDFLEIVAQEYEQM